MIPYRIRQTVNLESHGELRIAWKISTQGN